MGKNGFIGSEYGVAGSTLKLFAIITMLIDHTGAAVVGTIITLGNYRTADYELYRTLSTLYGLMRGIGRLAFPVFCFLLVEGFFHTRSVRKYCERLFLFALISEFPFDFALKPSAVFWNKQNVYFTLLISLICLWMLEEFREKPCMQLLAMAACMLLADALMTDYNYKGVFLVAILYLFHDYRGYQCAAGAAAISWESYAPLSFILCYLYNGKRGLKLRYIFYWFYPAHLIILGILRRFVIPSMI